MYGVAVLLPFTNNTVEIFLRPHPHAYPVGPKHLLIYLLKGPLVLLFSG
jgi:hypothetical protein